MPEEAYEMTRSLSEASTDNHYDAYDSREEEAQLLDKDNHTDTDGEGDIEDEEEAWAMIAGENGGDTEEVYEKDHPTIRYVCIGLAIGLFFAMFKVAMMQLSYDPHHERGAEKLFNNGTEYFASTVILISLDGFRPDYLNRGKTPHMKQLADDGVMAKYMHPAFPPSTFPNHWTLVTGLYPETHGIVANMFYDPALDAVFSHSNSTSTSDHRWWKGQPIWATSKMNRKRSASIMWPGSEINYNAPDFVVKFNATMKTKEKMDTTLNWLDLPYNERPQMISIYVPQIDQEGHRGGPFGSKMGNFIQDADNAIGYLVEELKNRQLEDHVHIVIVSDHGMAETQESKLIFYDDILTKDVLQHVRNREALPLLDLRPSPDAPKDTVEKIYNQLYNYTQTQPDAHFKVFLRQDVPERFHYKHSERITPIVAIPDAGYTFLTHKEFEKEGGFKKGGNHGYDNLADDMRAIFMAKGPKINKVYKAGTLLAPFFNIEVYDLLAELLNIDAAPNNGTLQADFPVVFEPPF